MKICYSSDLHDYSNLTILTPPKVDIGAEVDDGEYIFSNVDDNLDCNSNPTIWTQSDIKLDDEAYSTKVDNLMYFSSDEDDHLECDSSDEDNMDHNANDGLHEVSDNSYNNKENLEIPRKF